jgi:Flp pilus assembly pilin Flp
MEKLIAFFKDEEGLETVEYGIILGLIVAGTVGLVVTLGQWVEGQFTAVNTEIAGEGAAPVVN